MIEPSSTTGGSLPSNVDYLSRIPEALAAVDEEQRRIEAEQKAFKKFAAEVQQLDATDGPKATVASIGSSPFSGSRSGSIDTTGKVRTLYRETVMAVDHYEAEYDESLLVNIASEFGTDFGTALSTDNQLTTPLQQALVRTSRVAALDRKRLASLVQSEIDALTDAEMRVQNAAETIEQIRTREFKRQPIENFENSKQQLEAVKRESQSLILDRQAEFVDTPEMEGLNFKEYLYQEYEWRHPVVGDALDIIKDAQEAKQQITEIVSDQI